MSYDELKEIIEAGCDSIQRQTLDSLNAYFTLQPVLKELADRILDYQAVFSEVYSGMPNLLRSLSDVLTSACIQNATYSALISDWKEILNYFADLVIEPDEPDSANVAQDIEISKSAEILQVAVSAVEAASPYVPEIDQSNLSEALAVPAKKKKLSLSDLIALASLLLTILFHILSSQPSEQLERIIDQNEVIINELSEPAEPSEVDAELMETIATLTNSIEMLTDEIESLRDQLESSDNAEDVAEDDADCDGHDENGDTE